MFLYLPQCAGE